MPAVAAAAVRLLGQGREVDVVVEDDGVGVDAVDVGDPDDTAGKADSLNFDEPAGVGVDRVGRRDRHGADGAADAPEARADVVEDGGEAGGDVAVLPAGAWVACSRVRPARSPTAVRIVVGFSSTARADPRRGDLVQGRHTAGEARAGTHGDQQGVGLEPADGLADRGRGDAGAARELGPRQRPLLGREGLEDGALGGPARRPAAGDAPRSRPAMPRPLPREVWRAG